jgi:putative hydrolase of the HAD superfamily
MEKSVFSAFFAESGNPLSIIAESRIFQRFLSKTVGRVDYRLLAKAIAAYRKRQPGMQKPYPNTARVLSTLRRRGYRLGVVSDAPRLKAYMRLAEMGLLDHFDVIVTRDDTGRIKPHPRPFLLAARKMREKPRNILFVGDSPQRDIRGAQEIGMETAWARYGYPKRYLTAKHHHQAKHAKGIKADHTLSRISELLAILPKPKKD